jgi:Na+-exporting ATPase
MSTEIGKIAKALESKAAKTDKGFKAFWWKTKVLLGVADTTPLQIK